MSEESVVCPACTWANDPRPITCEACNKPLATVGMVDPLGQVVRECEGGRLPWKSVALTYAFALRQTFPGSAPGGLCSPEWKTANEAVMARFGPKGLAKVKDLAWAYLEGRKTPGVAT